MEGKQTARKAVEHLEQVHEHLYSLGEHSLVSDVDKVKAELQHRYDLVHDGEENAARGDRLAARARKVVERRSNVRK